MLTVLRGRERSGAQCRALLADAGFRVIATTSTPYTILQVEPGPAGTPST